MPSNAAITSGWPRDARDAIAIQHQLKDRVQLIPGPHTVSSICGLDVGYDPATSRSFAAGVLFDTESMRPVHAARAELPTEFPYIPGLLSFREIPVLLKVLERLPPADLLMVDGQGIAHPRRLGIASHLGVLIDQPAIGVAKSKLCGRYKEVANTIGATSLLIDGKERIGTVLRSKQGCLRCSSRPVIGWITKAP